jgi:hypothetical protein
MQHSPWPNFFIVGAPKAGTSSLHAYLNDMPGVFMSRIKEPNYFSRVVVPLDHPVRPIRDTDAYLQLFAGSEGHALVGEASPTYLADPEAPRLIREVSPESRILISLRDPVERAYSHYLMMRNNGFTERSFVDEIARGFELRDRLNIALLRPDVGLYRDQVARYFDTFGTAKVMVVIFEEFMADPAQALRSILAFAGIGHDIGNFRPRAYRQYAEVRGKFVRRLFGNRTIARLSESLVPSGARKWVRDRLLTRQAAKPSMDAEGRQVLTDFYRVDVRALSQLLGRPLPWRNFPEVQAPTAGQVA